MHTQKFFALAFTVLATIFIQQCQAGTPRNVPSVPAASGLVTSAFP
jgi:hypothetical protein